MSDKWPKYEFVAVKELRQVVSAPDFDKALAAFRRNEAHYKWPEVSDVTSVALIPEVGPAEEDSE